MRTLFGLVLIVGLGLAGLAVYMARNYISEYQFALAKERENRNLIIETTEVYVANRPLKYGDVLKEDDVELVKYPTGSLPDGVFTDLAMLFPESEDEDDVRRIILRAIEPKEVLLNVKMTNPGQSGGITTQLAKGQRAFALRVDVSSGVSGFLRPGDRVDVFWTGRARNANGKLEEMTTLIGTNVKLIAIDQIADSGSTSTMIARTVTVSASPNEVARLAQGQSTGRLSLALVGATDTTMAEAVEVDQNSLLGVQVAATEPAEIPKREKVCTIRTRRGAQVVEIPIPCRE
ncbi:MAG: Flp pilus assembly protein CpaB [Paracoccaceae bacterium]|jgi:pilus assembly protein CpaB|nr:Flp pilus assembly protein CpaB [Paracoccaceae bacterium]MDP7185887.1 Flp pilus assembly protein CpaB [Paracoccaceae bacterium]